MNHLREHQLDLMLVLIGICLILAVITFMTRSLSARRKTLLKRRHRYREHHYHYRGIRQRLCSSYRGSGGAYKYKNQISSHAFFILAAWVLRLFIPNHPIPHIEEAFSGSPPAPAHSKRNDSPSDLWFSAQKIPVPER